MTSSMGISAAIALILAMGTAQAQPASGHDDMGMTHHDDRPAGKSGYAPGLGEIMALQQMRHSKLWFAGRAGNWKLADYEFDELKEGFDDAKTYSPTHGDVPVAQMIGSIMPQPLAALEGAIKARDAAKFTAAFDGLTAACNTCHQGADHGFIVIRRPTTLPYTNQDFAPARP